MKASRAAKIRPLSAGDSAAIVALVEEHVAEENGGPIDRQALTEVLRAFAGSPNDRVLVAEVDEAVVGYVAVHWLPFPLLRGWEGYVSDLIVASGARGRGVGGRLLDAVEAEASARGCVRLMLNNRRQAVSFRRAFYPKHGFRERDDFGNFVKPLRSR